MQNSEADKLTQIQVPKEKSYSAQPIVLTQSFQAETYPLDITFNIIFKRLIDIVLSLIITVFILIWLLPLLAIIIKFTSKGSIFFVQARTGYNNQTFNCWKLRSMVRNSEANHKQATSNDMRITFAGKYLRKYSLDELPQFYNVLKGEMSIVGPRPHMLYHTTEFSKEILTYNTRHAVKPGITGLAQVLGYRGEIIEKRSLHNRVRLDIFYMKKWSIFFDFFIMIKTIKLLMFVDTKAV
jgi:putative colanic acid biosynthesis UDP-glucose lipid carrier transferase